jgi:bifunctional N-acetylglucosamine-1-phosphate-uridyltransferase/glucosamine-1-phosphate-acetyltransferase GlmU-like protein
MAELSGPRAHLKLAVIVAFGTGMRMREQLRMIRHQVEDSKRVAVEAIKLSARKNVQVLASWQKQPPVPAAVSR